ncbi:MAG TPA: ATP-binding protein, partial [Bacteroidia bacterium]|nr:ATP-binding protein [Bacteroidia bacterium]
MEKLIDFLKFIQKNHIEEVARESLKDSREMNLPILKLFAHVPDEVLIPQSIKGINDFVDSLVDGTYLEKQMASLKLWEEDKLPGIKKEDIEPTDLVLIYVIQKKGYFKFIPLYTKDSQLAIDIVLEMEALHFASQNEGVNLLFKMRKNAEAQLELANKELESFSYSVSHDLRAPLRAIHGYTKILLEDYSPSFDSEAQRMMNSVMRNTERMGQLIDDLLSFSRMGKKEMVITKVNMTDLARSSWNEINSTPQAAKVNLTVNNLPPAMADRALMSQVLSNLISNAVKYSGKKDTPVIEVSSTEKDGELIYCVKDNGVGFDMKYYDKLFGVFQRLHSNAEFEGTGIGLALVKRIITRHGGRIWAEGEPDKGAAFYFS